MLQLDVRDDCDSVASIGNYSFRQCSSLASVTIPDSVTSIGDQAFYECFSLASVTIPDSVTSIGDHAFRQCSSLASVTIPDSVTVVVMPLSSLLQLGLRNDRRLGDEYW